MTVATMPISNPCKTRASGSLRVASHVTTNGTMRQATGTAVTKHPLAEEQHERQSGHREADLDEERGNHDAPPADLLDHEKRSFD